MAMSMHGGGPHRMEASIPFTPAELWTAWSTCQAARRRWLMTDPLGFPEFELAGRPPLLSPEDGGPPEIEFQSKPRQGGGLRQEVLFDVVTATFLQAVANRLSERDLGLEHSLSARLFGLRLKHENPYQLWSTTVPAWIRRELGEGRVVILGDVRNYYGSIGRARIERALQRGALGDALVADTLARLDAINAIPDAAGITRSGLPVSPEEFIWLLADLVLAPVDQSIERSAGVLAYARWVDDILISTNAGNADRAIELLRGTLQEHGLDLNLGKTRVITSQRDFETAFLHDEHRIVTDLFLTQTAGSISPQQQEALEALIRRPGVQSIEQARLWKRIYGLARRIRSPLLLTRALADLERFPGAELQILGYLGAFGWPDDAAAKIVSSFSGETSDTRTLGALRTLLATTWEMSSDLDRALRSLVTREKCTVHPFCAVLAFACLRKATPSGRSGMHGEALLQAVDGLGSPAARRVALELLWLQPALRPALRERVAADRSRTVRALGPLLARDPAQPVPAGLVDRLRRATKAQIFWGDVDGSIARELHIV
jgi:hypothetical protein